MAKVLYAGGRLNSVSPVGNVYEANDAYYNTYATCSLAIGDISGTYADVSLTDQTGASTTVVTGQTLWFHTVFTTPSFSSSNMVIRFYDSSGFPWFGVMGGSSGSNLRLVYNTGTGASPVWTVLATLTGAVNDYALTTLDIKLTLGSPHAYEVSINQNLATSGTFTQASFADTAKVRLGYSAYTSYFSEILITEGISTVGARVKYTTATGAGANSDFSGTASDINEQICNDTTNISSGTAGQISTFAWGDVTLPSGYAIKDVFIWSRGKNDGASPTNLKTVIRASGTNYASANMSGIGTSYGSLLYRTDTNPATSAAWTSAGFNAVEIGFESAA